MATIENDLDLIGATAIEDKLQNGVPDAVADLAKAGIKVWVLTGDKQETAINIGFATQLLRRDMDRTILNGLQLDTTNTTASNKYILKTPAQLIDELKDALSRLAQKQANKDISVPVQALIVDGKALDIVFNSSASSQAIQQSLLQFVRQCGAVVACRVSPLQKAQMVNLVKQNEKGVKTLSIGDGANDVPMIQMAHVGVGISGQEGMQAVNASDYAIGQFRFLTRLLMVHGRWNYRRMSVLVSYMFYKNIVLCMVPWFYFLYNGFSSTEGGSSILLGRTIFNVTYTGLPIVLIGTYDRDLSQYMSQKYSRLYRDGPKGVLFNAPRLLQWLCMALYHSILIVLVCLYIVPVGGLPIDMGLAEFGWYSMFFTIYVCNIKLIHSIEMWFWWITFGFVFSSLLAYPLVYYVFGHGAGMVETEDHPFPNAAFFNTNFWIGFLFITSLALIPEMIFNFFKRRYATTFHDLAQEVEQLAWYRLKCKQAGEDMALYPVHPQLDALNNKLWEEETKGIGQSQDDHGTGTDFSMDDETSLAHGTTFRKKQKHFHVPQW
jgi:phospholipid-translocating P-type ATPase (flippase)